jgi:hypothetical protein
MTVLFGMIALLVVVWFARGFLKANPAILSMGVRTTGGIAALAAAAFLMLRGQIELGGLLAVVGLGLLGQRALLAAYFDRRNAGWREDADSGAAAGKADPARSGKMTEEEAYQILGIAPGASAEEIGRAHRQLMKKLHPDQGGSNYLAARVNAAKDVLLRSHRR